MSGAKLEVGLEPHPDGFGASGRERVEFRVATNPGLPVSPLRDAASGGELSRVMLALARPGRSRRRRRPSSSTRSTPGSAATPPAPSASGCARSAPSARCSASPTCRRSPRWPRPTSGSRRASRASQATARRRARGRRRAGRGDRAHAGRRPRRRDREQARPRAARRPRSGPRRSSRIMRGRWRPPAAAPSRALLRHGRNGRRRRAARPVHGTARLGQAHQGPGQAARPAGRRGDRPPQPRPDRRRGAGRDAACAR